MVCTLIREYKAKKGKQKFSTPAETTTPQSRSINKSPTAKTTWKLHVVNTGTSGTIKANQFSAILVLLAE